MNTDITAVDVLDLLTLITAAEGYAGQMRHDGATTAAAHVERAIAHVRALPDYVPNPVVLEADHGIYTIRTYANGMVDAVSDHPQAVCSLSPGFDSWGACLAWLDAEGAALDARARR